MGEAIAEAPRYGSTQSSLAKTILVRAPATGDVIGEVPLLSESEVREAVQRANLAQRSWSQLSVEERSERVGRIGEVFVERAEELVDLLAREAGKPRNEALAHEVLTTVDLCHFYSRNASRILADAS